MTTDRWSWAQLFPRLVLGLMFFMAGWWKVTGLGAIEHAARFFVEGYAESWIPTWLLWATGTAIPFVELLAGALLLLGFRRREALVALGGVLVIVTYGHLLAEPLFDTTAHIFPRLALLTYLFSAPMGRDAFSLDGWLARRRCADGLRRGGSGDGA